MIPGQRFIFISPHLDDAVLSCYPMICSCLEQGIPVEIWTIMAGIPSDKTAFSDTAQQISKSDPVGYVQRRQLEDLEVGKAIGVPVQHFNFTDAIYRTDPSKHPLYPDLCDIFHHVDFRDLYLANRIYEALSPLLTANDVVVAPSAICGHVDHILTRLACEMLPMEILFYDEFPYMVQRHSTVSPEVQSEWVRMVGLYASQMQLLFPGNTLQDLISIHQPVWSPRARIQPLIPRKLHLIWIGDSPMSPDAQKNYKTWVRLLGTAWQVRLWTNDDLHNEQFSNEVLNCIQNARHGMQKADILRYQILSKEGGWYFDLDFEPIQSIEPLALLLNGEELILCHEEELRRDLISNGFFACSAGNTYMTAIAAAVLTQPLNTGALDVGHIVYYTGPYFFNAKLDHAPAFFLPNRLLYPVTFSEILSGQQHVPEFGFARHKWHNRYRDNKALYFDVEDKPEQPRPVDSLPAENASIMLFCFVRDEYQLLKHWIPYHADLVGMENIMIIDHGSNEETKSLIDGFTSMGLRVYDAGSFPFTEKEMVLSRVMGRFKHYRFLVPLDSDEFLCLHTEDGMDCSKMIILEAFNALPCRPVVFKMGTFDVCNTPDVDYEDPLLEMTSFHFFPPETTEVFSTAAHSKSFFAGSHFIATDAGNHHGHIDASEGDVHTRIALAHFHTRGYRHFISKHVQADLALGVTDLEEYIRTKNKGWHWMERKLAIKNGEGRHFFETKMCTLQGQVETALCDALKKLAGSPAGLKV